jgi:hypothetical protein
MRRGRSGSGAPESPVSGACAGNAPKLPKQSLTKGKITPKPAFFVPGPGFKMYVLNPPYIVNTPFIL